MSLGLISFVMDKGNEGSRDIIAKEEKTNTEISRVFCIWSEFPGPNGNHQGKVSLHFNKSKFPNVTNISDITLWQEPLNTDEEQLILATRVHKLILTRK